jgi:hypothetical protein
MIQKASGITISAVQQFVNSNLAAKLLELARTGRRGTMGKLAQSDESHVRPLEESR